MITNKRRAQLFVWHQVERKGFPPAKNFQCVDCDNAAQHYDHFKGYARRHWFDVQPVCISCHLKREHARNPQRIKNVAQKNSRTCAHGIKPIKNCVECRRVYWRKWRKKDLDKDRKRCLKYYYAHR